MAVSSSKDFFFVGFDKSSFRKFRFDFEGFSCDLEFSFISFGVEWISFDFMVFGSGIFFLILHSILS